MKFRIFLSVRTFVNEIRRKAQATAEIVNCRRITVELLGINAKIEETTHPLDEWPVKETRSKFRNSPIK
jgi:hypothetical protein